MLITLAVDLAGTVFGTTARTAAAATTTAARFSIPLFVGFACSQIGALSGVRSGLDLRRLRALSARCLSGGDRNRGHGDGCCRSRSGNLHGRVGVLLRRLLAGITCFIAAVASASTATAAAVALAVLVGLLGVVVSGKNATFFFTRRSRCATVVLIGSLASLCTAFTAIFRAAATSLAIAAPALSTITSTALAFTTGRVFDDFSRLGCGLGFDLRSRATAEPADQAFEQTRRGLVCDRGHNRLVGSLLGLSGRGGRHRRGLLGRNALDQRFGLSLDLLFLRRPTHVRRWCVDQIETGLEILETGIVVTQTLNVVVGCFQVTVRDEDQIDLQPRFDLGDVAALFVEQEGGHIDRNLCVHGSRVFLHGFFLQQAQHLKRARLGIANDACAVATRAGDVRAFVQSGTQTLA